MAEECAVDSRLAGRDEDDAAEHVEVQRDAEIIIGDHGYDGTEYGEQEGGRQALAGIHVARYEQGR